MAKKEKLTPKQANQVLKDCMLFILSSMEYHELIYPEQYSHWIEQLKDIGTYSYLIKEYEGETFENLLKNNKKKIEKKTNQ